MVPQYNNLKVLLIGASGMLGNRYYKKSSKLFNLLGTSTSDSSYEKLDVTNSHSLKELLSAFSPDVIVNCSAYTDVDGAEENKKMAYDVNVKGMHNLIKYSKKKTKIVHFSTDYIFDGKDNDYTEKSLPAPLNYYGKTKLEAENILRSSNRRFLIFRINGLFDFNGKNFYTWVFENLTKSKTINVVNDQSSNPTYTDNLVDVINECLILDAEGIFNFGTKNNISRYDFAKIIAKTNNFNLDLINPIKSADLNQLACRPENTYLNCNKIENFLNIDLCTVQSILDRENANE